jgi:hypothetical protein
MTDGRTRKQVKNVGEGQSAVCLVDDGCKAGRELLYNTLIVEIWIPADFEDVGTGCWINIGVAEDVEEGGLIAEGRFVSIIEEMV